MKTIKNMRGFKASLRARGYEILESCDDAVIIARPNCTTESIKEELRGLYLNNHRLSYMDIFLNCENNIVLDVAFYRNED